MIFLQDVQHLEPVSLVEKLRTETGVELYDKLRQQSVRPTVPVILSALKACMSSQDLSTGRRIHSQISQSSEEVHSYISNALVSMYAKCGSMPEALEVFSSMKLRTTVSWNAMILGYAEAGQSSLALEMFSSMKEDGECPNRVTFLAAIKACSNLAELEQGRPVEGNVLKVNSLEKGRALHSQISGTELELHKFVASSLVDMYGKCGSMSDAQSVFDRMKARDVVSWTSIILGYAESGAGSTALLMFSRMRDEGVSPNSVTYLAALKACVSCLAHEKGTPSSGMIHVIGAGKVIHSEILRVGKEGEKFLANALLDMYGKCGSLIHAQLLFDRMEVHNTVSWNAMILGNPGKQALYLYGRMEDEGYAPDGVTYLAVLKACISLASESEDEALRNKCLERGREVHSRLKETGEVKLISMASTLVDFYGKCGSLIEARKVFDSMEDRDVLAWTAMMSSYAQSGENDQALELFILMHEEGIEPNSVTFVAALTACGNSGALHVGRAMHAGICRAGVAEKLDLPVATALIEMYGKCGSFDEAERVFGMVVSPDLVAWNSMLAALSRQGNSWRVIQLVREMIQDRCLKPSEATFVSVLSCYGHSGMVDRARSLFWKMVEDFKLRPSSEHYSCIVDLLGRANRLEEALEIVELVRSSGSRESLSIWMAILSGCRRWGDLKVGKMAFEEIMKLDEEGGSHSAAYVLMSNIYSTAGGSSSLHHA